MTLRDVLRIVGNMIEIEPVIQDDPGMPAPVPLRYVSDITRISDELGWQPQVGIDDGLRAIL